MIVSMRGVHRARQLAAADNTHRQGVVTAAALPGRLRIAAPGHPLRRLPLHQHFPHPQQPALKRTCNTRSRTELADPVTTAGEPEEPAAAAAAATTTPPLPAPAPAAPAPRAAWYTDAGKEQGRKEMRTSFDFERWRMHRSSGRYLRHVLGITSSRIFQGLAKPLLYVMLTTAAVGGYHAAAAAGHVPLWANLKVAANTLLGLTSFALSLLLVFRTNTSFARFDEARRMWGLIVNSSRNLVRQGVVYMPEDKKYMQDKLCRWTIAFTRSLMCHVREGDNLEEELKNTLEPHELQALLASAHKPVFCSQVLTEIIKDAQFPATPSAEGFGAWAVPALIAQRMDENVSTFSDVTGGCERLLRTPIPLSYTRHTSRFMMIWLTVLPFTLWSTCGWAMLPISGLIAFLLLGIEEIGVQIEEPFSILPLEAICNAIEANVWQMHRTHVAV